MTEAREWTPEQCYLTPEEATARTGFTLEELVLRLPHLRLGRPKRLIRFNEARVNELAAGNWCMTLHEVNRDFATLHRRAGLVYFIEAVGADRIKIGFTSKSSADDRRRELQTSSPFELRVLCELAGSLGVERYLHARHASERILPTAEWFHHRGSVAQLTSHVLTHGKWP